MATGSARHAFEIGGRNVDCSRRVGVLDAAAQRIGFAKHPSRSIPEGGEA
jgi:hypothetical protein